MQHARHSCSSRVASRLRGADEIVGCTPLRALDPCPNRHERLEGLVMLGFPANLGRANLGRDLFRDWAAATTSCLHIRFQKLCCGRTSRLHRSVIGRRVDDRSTHREARLHQHERSEADANDENELPSVHGAKHFRSQSASSLRANIHGGAVKCAATRRARACSSAAAPPRELIKSTIPALQETTPGTVPRETSPRARASHVTFLSDRA